MAGGLHAARHLPSSPPRDPGPRSVVVPVAHPPRGLAHLAGAVAHPARAFLQSVGGFDQLLMGDVVAARGFAGDDLLAIGAIPEMGGLLLHAAGAAPPARSRA